MSHYAREDDIVWLTFEGYDGEHAWAEGHDWGLVERDERTGQVVAVELWRASQRLPAGLLAELPEPAATPVVVDRGDGTRPRAA